MALLYRMKQVKLNHLLSHHFQTFYFRSSFPVLHRPPLYTNNNPFHHAFCRTPLDFSSNTLRFFAAPVQPQKKEVVKDADGVRLNGQIKADVVRLVINEQEHIVVSKSEALRRAEALKLDLVEVDRQAKPPVCKIMDYNRERYKQQLWVKERTKSKAVGSIKKGDCKDVRFSAKAELKDLKIKADQAKRLMERGYRVKCTALGTEDQDLGGLLSKVCAMIEDIAIVDSGPRVEKKQAYVIVRHVKFGPSKKGGKKASKVDGDISSKIQNAAHSEEDTYSAESGMDNDDEVDAPLQGQKETTWSVSDANQDFNKVFNVTKISSSDAASSATTNSASGFSPSRAPNSMDPNVRPPAQITENRYARNATKNASGVRNPIRFSGSQPQSSSSAHPTGGPRDARGEGSASRSFQHPQNGIPGPRGELSRPDILNQARQFDPVSNLSTPRHSGTTVKSHGSQRSGTDDRGKKWGQFSKD